MKWLTAKRIFRAGMLSFSRNAFVSFASILVMTVTLFTVGVTLFAGVILGSALDELGDNPLGAVLNIKAKDISQYESISAFLKDQQSSQAGGASIIDKINFYDAQHRAALERLQYITNSAKVLGQWIVAILILTTLAISFNTLRLAIYSSRDEIQVMRLVGAGSFYIRAPFMVEGVLYGLIAGIVTLLIFYPLTWWLGGATGNFFGGVNIFNYYLSNFLYFFFVIIGTGVVLGALASFLAVRRYLKI